MDRRNLIGGLVALLGLGGAVKASEKQSIASMKLIRTGRKVLKRHVKYDRLDIDDLTADRTINLYWNGMRQMEGADYTVDGSSVKFIKPIYGNSDNVVWDIFG